MADVHNGQIPLVARSRAQHETGYVLSAIDSGALGGGGTFGAGCERFFERELPAHRVFLTSSCTAALHLAGQALGLGPGDEVIVPSFTFASCASVFASLGAGIVFADCRSDTFNIDERSLPALIGPRTKAVLVVHYAGVPCEMDMLLRVTLRAGIPIIEDCAHGPFATYRGRSIGTMGALAALSFDCAKNYTCGEGGALVVNEPHLVEPVEIAYHRGTNRADLLRGRCAVYEWLTAGGNYALSELQAAFLLAQLERRQQIHERRRIVWERYSERLARWSADRHVTLPLVPSGCEPAYHLYPILFPSREARDIALRHLSLDRIASAPHYTPLHRSSGARRHAAQLTACPQVDDFHDRLLRVPLHTELMDDDVERVVSALLAFEEAPVTRRRH